MPSLDRELTARRLGVRVVTLTIAITRPSRARLSRQPDARNREHDGRYEPGAHFPSVTVCFESFHVPPVNTKVALTPSFSGGVTGGTGLPVAW